MSVGLWAKKQTRSFVFWVNLRAPFCSRFYLTFRRQTLWAYEAACSFKLPKSAISERISTNVKTGTDFQCIIFHAAATNCCKSPSRSQNNTTKKFFLFFFSNRVTLFWTPPLLRHANPLADCQPCLCWTHSDLFLNNFIQKIAIFMHLVTK